VKLPVQQKPVIFQIVETELWDFIYLPGAIPSPLSLEKVFLMTSCFRELKRDYIWEEQAAYGALGDKILLFGNKFFLPKRMFIETTSFCFSEVSYYLAALPGCCKIRNIKVS
jgi:hypothetical protein